MKLTLEDMHIQTKMHSHYEMAYCGFKSIKHQRNTTIYIKNKEEYIV